MYLEFYGLRKAPFQITPDPDFLFLSPSHKVALGAIIYGIEERQGFVVITGEVGLGKTTILRSYLERVDPHQLRTICIFNANISFEGILKTLYAEFDLEYHADDLFESVKQLHAMLIQEYEQGRNVALIIDEAQNMPVETLANMLMLSNLETATVKLLQIILIGQPEFEDTLNRPELRQLKQRLVIHEKIEVLTPQESSAYIHHRLDKVKTHTDPIFNNKAEGLLVKASRGTPRVLNTLCTNALIAGVGYQEKPVTARTVKQVTDNLLGPRNTAKRGFPWRYILAALAILLVLVFLWLSPLGEMITTPPLLQSARASVIARLKGIFPFLDSDAKPDTGSATDTPTPVTPPSSTTDAPQGQPAPSPESPVVTTSDNNPPSVAQPTPEAPPDPPSQNGLEPQPLDPAPEDTGSFPITVSVSPGENITDIAQEIYGFANEELFDLIKRNNPDITDLDAIKVGDKLILPALPEGLERFRGQ